MACRGTGTVISNLGGKPSTLPCPWCEGGGVRLPGVDAQARWAEHRPGEQAGAAAEQPGAPKGTGAGAETPG